MPNYVNNTLNISCDNHEIMSKIKEMIYEKDSSGNLNYTMEKLLPIPTELKGKPGYITFGLDWCVTVWGTKWDIIEPFIKESGETLTLWYKTVWSPNTKWVALLCDYIRFITSSFNKNKFPEIIIEHNYWEWRMKFGGNLFWTPYKKFKYHEYEIMEYAYLYNKGLYNWLIDKFDYEPFNPGWEKFRELLAKYST